MASPAGPGWLARRKRALALPVSQGINLILCHSLTLNRRGVHRVMTGCEARAIENQLYVVMSPLFGTDGTPYASSRRGMAETGAERVIVGCAIVSGCYELTARNNPDVHALSVIDPSVIALKRAETLADLNPAAQYRIARTGQYQKLEVHSTWRAEELYALLVAPIDRES